MRSQHSQTERRSPSRRGFLVVLLASLAAPLAAAGPQQGQPPVQVTIKDEKPVVVDPTVLLPVDPVRRIQYQPQGLAVYVSGERGERLHLSHFPSLLLDGQFLPQQGPTGRADFANRPLGKTREGKDREGFSSSYLYADGLRVTMTMTVVPTKPQTKAAKRRRDAVLIHYLIENQGKQAHKIGLRVYMDTYIVNNDGCLFAAPTLPNKLLDGIELEGKTLPPYVQLLQQPNLKNPGFVAHLTLDLGPKLEKPDRVVLTRHGQGFNMWNMQAIASMGDSGLGVYWEPKEIKPGGKREIAYGYGQGLVPSPESEGRVELTLGGSFVPGKRFTITARVHDPAAGQSLRLELPDGMTLLEGPEVQPVPAPQGEERPHSLVMWRARVLRPGAFTVRVHSSMGVTQGKLVTVSPRKN